MRKIVAGLFISLDGVVESPATWAYQYFDDEMADVIGAGIAQADAVLLGRRTYLEFAELWPSPARSKRRRPSDESWRCGAPCWSAGASAG